MNDVRSIEEQMLLAAIRVAELLQRKSMKVVFAESCTAGLIAATLSKIPGISESLCGSFVTYRNHSKHHWLNVSLSDLESPKVGAVSETVAQQMAIGALQNTPEASVAVSVTGHLGPNAPVEHDGLAYSAIHFRESVPASAGMNSVCLLELDLPLNISKVSTCSQRESRQQVAVFHVLQKFGTTLGMIGQFE